MGWVFRFSVLSPLAVSWQILSITWAKLKTTPERLQALCTLCASR
jgi:hypothetical protein